MAVKSNEKIISAKSRLYGFLGKILIAATAIVAGIVQHVFNVQRYILMYQLIILLAAGVGIYFILRKTFYEYVYTFSRDHFLIHQIVGSKDVILFAVDYKDILDFGPLSALQMDQERKNKLDKFYLAETTLDVYYLRYRDINNKCDKILTFKPSAPVIEALSAKIS